MKAICYLYATILFCACKAAPAPNPLDYGGNKVNGNVASIKTTVYKLDNELGEPVEAKLLAVYVNTFYNGVSLSATGLQHFEEGSYFYYVDSISYKDGVPVLKQICYAGYMHSDYADSSELARLNREDARLMGCQNKTVDSLRMGCHTHKTESLVGSTDSTRVWSGKERAICSGDTVKTYTITKSYDASRRLITDMVEHSGGGDRKIVWTFDENGNLLKGRYLANGIEVVNTYTYEFDKHNNWVKRVTYNEGKAVAVEVREIEYS